jgi:hypothetical protein
VSWRFEEPDAAEAVAILMPGATPEHFRVIAYNTTGNVQRATMTGWSVTAGEWTMQGSGAPQALTLERSASTQVAFAPGETTLDFTLVKAGTPVEQRPDLGIGADDVAVAGRRVTLTVHNLGAQAAAGGQAMLVTPDGRSVASAPIPTLDAPTDLLPRTATVRLAIPAGFDPATLSAQIALPGGGAEVTLLNNRVALPRQ